MTFQEAVSAAKQCLLNVETKGESVVYLSDAMRILASLEASFKDEEEPSSDNYDKDKNEAMVEKEEEEA